MNIMIPTKNVHYWPSNNSNNRNMHYKPSNTDSKKCALLTQLCFLQKLYTIYWAIPSAGMLKVLARLQNQTLGRREVQLYICKDLMFCVRNKM